MICSRSSAAPPGSPRCAGWACLTARPSRHSISLVDQERQFFKSFVGLGEPWASRRETPLSHSFCRHVVESGEPLIIHDAPADPRVCDNLAIPDMGIMAYVGIPLLTRDGEALGSFCAIDTTPRIWSADEIDILRDLAASVMTEIELRSDIAERKQAEQAFRESEASFQGIFANAAIGIALADLEGAIVESNPAFQSMLHYSAEELSGRAFSDITHPDDVARDWELANELIAGKRDQYRMEKRYYRKDGQVVWANLTMSLIRGAERHPQFAIGMVEDITYRKRVEQEREQLIEALKDALANIKTLRGLLPICALCKKIRDDTGYWNQIETYIQAHSEADFTHSVCPECAHRIYPDLFVD
jgi:PAS domain S-box-containing protein